MEEFYSALPNLDLSGGGATSQYGNAASQPGNPASNYNPYGAYQPTMQPQQHTQPQPQSGAPLPPDPSLAQTNPEEWRRQFHEYNQAMIRSSLGEAASQYSRPLVEGQAQTARELSRRDPRYSDVWARFGHEIDREMASVPMERRTKRTYDQACDMVRGRHFDELAAERASQPQQRPTNATATGSAPQSPTGVERAERKPLDEFWDSESPAARRYRDAFGSKNAVRERIRAMGVTEAKWVEQASNGAIVVSQNGNKQQATASVGVE